MRLNLSADDKCAVRAFLFALSVVFAATATSAQKSARITHPIDDNAVKVLSGSTHPLATSANDVGRVDNTLPMDRIMLLLQPSADQKAALTRFISHQSDKDSPQFHQWLSPEQFGARFGPAQEDIDQVTGWLQSHGLRVNSVARGKQWIEFSGTAAQVEHTFHTEIHQYLVKGEMHIANAKDISLPEALTPVVAGVLSLHNFQKHPMHTEAVKVRRDATTNKLVPEFTFHSGQFHLLAPGDFSRIYNTLPLLNAGINGKDISIGIVARSNIELSDVQTFRQIFGLPAKDPNFIINGVDPGANQNGEEVEADLDTEWSGAAAPQATINLVISASTFTSDGSDLSLAYIIDHRVASIVSSSFGLCEAFLSPAGNAFFERTYQQAAAQGMTVFVDTGDNGAAGCDEPLDGRSVPATLGLNVNGIASTSFNIAVGGTQFAEQGNDGSFWLASNRADLSSAIGYIPEAVWNESCDPTVDPGHCGDGRYSIAAGSGGKSSCINSQVVGNTINCINGYPKPSWQAGPTILNDGVRDVPDVSLTAGSGHDGYLICIAGFCQTSISNGKTVLDSAFVVGGTSASTPAMAGIMALVEQKNGAFQGLANFNFYKLAATENLANCNSTLSTNPLQRPNCIFQDVTQSNNSVPGQLGFNAGPGFDLATGLGSVNAAKLANSWNTGTKLATQMELSLPVSAVQHGHALPVNVSVQPVSGNGAPSGDFDLFAGSSTSIFGGTLLQGVFSGFVNGLPGGQYQVQAHYGGDPMFKPSNSNSVPLSVTPEPSSVALVGLEVTQFGNLIPPNNPFYGQPIVAQIDVAGKSGIGSPSGSVTIFDNKTPLGTVPLNEGGNLFAEIDNLTATGLLVGHHDIRAAYSGDASFQPSLSADVAFMVNKQSPNARIFAVPNPPIAGAPAQFLLFVGAILGQVLPTGTVDIFDNGKRIGAHLTLKFDGLLGPGVSQAAFTTSFSAGFHDVEFTYSGDKTFNSIRLGDHLEGHVDFTVAAASGAETIIQVQQTPLTVALSQTASYAVSVSPVVAGGLLPTGTVSLIGPNGAVFAGPVSLVNGKASLPLTFDAAGPFEIAAGYSGDDHYRAFSSDILTTMVTKGTPTVSLTTPAGTVKGGMQTSFSVSVVGNPAVPQITTPFGFVQFFDSINGSAFQSLGSPQFLTVGNGGNPIFALPVVLATGNHVVKAEYLGSADWAPTFSNLVNVVIQP